PPKQKSAAIGRVSRSKSARRSVRPFGTRLSFQRKRRAGAHFGAMARQGIEPSRGGNQSILRGAGERRNRDQDRSRSGAGGKNTVRWAVNFKIRGGQSQELGRVQL